MVIIFLIKMKVNYAYQKSFLKATGKCWPWWHAHLIPVLGKQRQVDLCDWVWDQSSLANSRQPGLHRERSCFRKEKKRKKKKNKQASCERVSKQAELAPSAEAAHPGRNRQAWCCLFPPFCELRDGRWPNSGTKSQYLPIYRELNNEDMPQNHLSFLEEG